MVVGKLEIELVHSNIGCTQKQRATVQGLGLHRLHERRRVVDTPAIRGMIAKVAHLVSIVCEEEKSSSIPAKTIKKTRIVRKKKES